MSFSEEQSNDLLVTATEHFNEGRYKQAETILNQLVLKGLKKAVVFHMLGTVYYDQGKFNKAIRAFRRALEIDPGFTDASVGLSIILNDLGRYEEGRKVFDEAKTMLASQSEEGDPYVDEKISIKHDELGELYFHYKRYDEALREYRTALDLSERKAELSMKVVECLIHKEEVFEGIQQLKSIIADYPEFTSARIKLGKLFYDSHQVPEAIEQWEEVLRVDPENNQAKDYLRLAQSIEVVQLDKENESHL